MLLAGWRFRTTPSIYVYAHPCKITLYSLHSDFWKMMDLRRSRIERLDRNHTSGSRSFLRDRIRLDIAFDRISLQFRARLWAIAGPDSARCIGAASIESKRRLDSTLTIG